MRLRTHQVFIYLLLILIVISLVCTWLLGLPDYVPDKRSLRGSQPALLPLLVATKGKGKRLASQRARNGARSTEANTLGADKAAAEAAHLAELEETANTERLRADAAELKLAAALARADDSETAAAEARSELAALKAQFVGGKYDRFGHRGPELREMGGEKDLNQQQADKAADLAAQQAAEEAAAELSATQLAALQSTPDTRTGPEWERANAVKAAMEHTWKGYETFAFGHDELLPVSGGFDDTWSKMAATMLDGMDTLWLMGLKDEFQRARDYVATRLNWDDIDGDVSVFETTIRAVGGLLSAGALSGDSIFAEKAQDLMRRMMPAFNSRTGLAKARVNPHTGKSWNYRWANRGAAILSEFGSLTLELNELSRTSGDQQFSKIGMLAYKTLQDKAYPNGMFGVYGDVKTGRLNGPVSFGAFGDSFYEYLLKAWLQTGRQHQWLRDMYDRAMDGLEKHLKYTSPSGLPWLPGLESNSMEHLTCFVPGMLALGTMGMPSSARVDRDLRLAKDFMETCWQMYKRTKTGISPDKIRFGHSDWSGVDREYKLRPETIESLFVLHKVTGDSSYREKGWEMFQHINQYCRTTHGYGHLPDVEDTGRPPRDKMESFWGAETLKYHYLLQMPTEARLKDSEWVFNTEAHPLPIQR